MMQHDVPGPAVLQAGFSRIGPTMAAMLLFGCLWSGESAPPPRILCSIYPVQLIARAVTNGRPGLQLARLLPAGSGCPHDFAPTHEDMRRLANAEVILANGLGLDGFLDVALPKANPRARRIDLAEGIEGLLPVARSQGPPTWNPHAFAAPRTAARMAIKLSRELSALDPAGTDIYRTNAEQWSADLNRLADELASAGLPDRPVVIQHDLQAYLVRDLGLRVACEIQDHPGQEPSARRLLHVVRTARAAGAVAVLAEPGSPDRSAETLAKELALPVVEVDVLSTGPEDPPLGHFRQAMLGNLSRLRAALSGR